MGSVLVIGGGWAGCAAALAAANRGVRVTLLERSDLLLGTGLVGGIYRNNGRLTALLEAQALGCGQLFEAMDQVACHRYLEFPGHKHAALYDVRQIEPLVRQILLGAGVTLRFMHRAIDVSTKEDRIADVTVNEQEIFTAAAYVETTGSSGGMPNCTRFGNGCAMCAIRCPSFGPRVSLAAKAGVLEIMGVRPDGRPGSMSGSCELHKSSLSPALQKELASAGVLLIPLPKSFDTSATEYKACQQYNLPAYKENLVILDTGHAKLMTPFFPLAQLRQLPGLENAHYLDPYAGGIGNSIRFTAVTPRDNHLKVDGLKNLFCAGEKAGFLVGHTEAIVTGTLAGFNAAAHALGQPLLELPTSLACGDIIAYGNPERAKAKAKVQRITFSGADYFARMCEQELYATDSHIAANKVKAAGLENIFAAI